MYNSTNLPLSPLKVIKKSIGTSALTTIVGGFFIGFGILLRKLPDGDNLPQVYFNWLIVFAILWIFFWVIVILIYEYLYYKLYYYNFEDGGAEIKKGVVSHATGHVRYERLQNIYIDQDFLDRIFGLYDIHYETAGEISGFYSHVDGLNKENADKLVAFLNERARGGQGQYNTTTEPSDASIATDNIARSSEQMGNMEISIKDCPMSKSVIFIHAFGISEFFTFLTAIGILAGYSEERWIASSVWSWSLWLILGTFLFMFVVALIWFSVWYKNFYFRFAQDKGEIRSKVIGQSISYLYYDRIQNINIEQGVIQRIFGIYSISIETAGETSGSSLRLIGFTRQNAEKLRDFLLEKAKKYRGRL